MAHQLVQYHGRTDLVGNVLEAPVFIVLFEEMEFLDCYFHEEFCNVICLKNENLRYSYDSGMGNLLLEYLNLLLTAIPDTIRNYMSPLTKGCICKVTPSRHQGTFLIIQMLNGNGPCLEIFWDNSGVCVLMSTDEFSDNQYPYYPDTDIFRKEMLKGINPYLEGLLKYKRR